MNLKQKLAIGGFALLSALTPAKAATLVVNDPVQGGTQYGLVATATNNDAGAIYDSTVFDSYATLGQQMFDLGVNPSYTSIDDLMNSSFNLSLSGSASSGWTPTAQIDGSVVGINNGAVPDVTYATFSTGRNQSLFALPDYADLELNATLGHQSFNLADISNASWDPSNYDATIVLSDNPMFQASNYNGSVAYGSLGTFTGTSEDTFSNWSSSAPKYVLANPNDFATVPEPSSAALLAGGLGLAYVMSRRRKE